MAENKKSFIAYSDWKDTFDALPNDKAGELIKHIFAYVNDENPQTDDILINAVFASIKNSLKRDLEKWNSGSESRIEKARKAGLASAKSRQLKATQINSLVQTPTNSTVSVSDSVSVSVNESVNNINNRLAEFKNSLHTFKDDYNSNTLNDFYLYWTEKKPKGKKMLFEMQKTFDISRRLARWNKNNFNKTPKKEKKDAAKILQERYGINN